MSGRRPPDALAPNRRRFLRAMTIGALAALAGCGGDSGSTATPTDGTRTPTVGDRSPSPSSGVAPTDRGSTTPTSTGTFSEPDARGRARRLTEWLQRGAYERVVGRFSENLAAQVPADRLRSAWEEQLSTVGQYVGIDRVATTTQDGGVTVEVVVEATEGLLTVALRFDDRGRVTSIFIRPALQSQGSYSPPAYADRDAFTEESRSIGVDGDCSLPATLSLPEGASESDPVPGVVLVHGSGPQDRNATVGPNQPFKDIAWGLASRGIAVLRYRKRTAECPPPPSETTIDSVVVDDALAAVGLLADAGAVNGGVTVIGHSLGGMAAPRIASRSDAVSRLVLMATPARPLWKPILDQNRHYARRDGTVSAEERRAIESVRQRGRQIASGQFDDGETILGYPGAFWRSVWEYDQVAVADELDLPIYVLQGGRDFQVPPEKDFAAWREALGDEPRNDFERYPDLNHLFLPGSGPSYLERYYREPDNVAKAVIEDLSSWIADSNATTVTTTSGRG